MLRRSRSVSDPRWSPAGTRLAWVEGYDGRSDLLVAPGDGTGPALVVTADCGVGGGYAWVDDDTLVVGGADGRLVVVHADGGVERTLTRDGRAFGPAVSARGVVACAIEHDDACDVATVPVDGSAWRGRVSEGGFGLQAWWET